MSKYLIFDIGGTYVKWAYVGDNYQILESNKFAFNGKEEGADKLLEKIGNLISDFEKNNEVKAIGVSTAGNVDPETTQILGISANIKNYGGKNIKQELAQYTNLPIFVENDANAAILGELVEESLASCQNALMITLGTDIGGGILLSGNLYRGYSGIAGEIGYQVVLGKRWGEYFSAQGLVKLLKEKEGIELNTYQILTSKNDKVISVLDQWYQGLAQGIANMIVSMNFEIIIIGGGISESELFDLSKLSAYIDEYLIEPQFISSYKLTKASKGNSAAIIGMTNIIKRSK